jgi:hypothetical protein
MRLVLRLKHMHIRTEDTSAYGQVLPHHQMMRQEPFYLKSSDAALAKWWVMYSLRTAGVALDGVGVMASVSPPLTQALAAAVVLAPEDALPVDVLVTEDDTPVGNLFRAN